MELKMEETDYTDIPSTNYWHQPPKENIKKKKVSFDDILTNMNLVVNQNGVLQFIGSSSTQQFETPSYNNQQNQIPLDASLKHSHIYNKYFKDYKDNTFKQIEPRTPKTIAEYNKMLLEDKITAMKQKQRISQIKSTKLLFTNAGNINATNNNLRKMAFN